MATLYGRLFGGGAQRKLEAAPGDFMDWASDRLTPSWMIENQTEKAEEEKRAQAAQVKADAERVRAEEEADEHVAEQNEMLDMLMARAQGRGPSAAQDTLKMGYDRAMRGALSTARGSRGNPALAARAAQRQQGQLTSEMGFQSGIISAKEQLASGEALSSAISSARRGDLAKAAGIWSNINADKLAELETKKLAMQKQQLSNEASSNMQMGVLNAITNVLAAYMAKGTKKGP